MSDPLRHQIEQVVYYHKYGELTDLEVINAKILGLLEVAGYE